MGRFVDPLGLPELLGVQQPMEGMHRFTEIERFDGGDTLRQQIPSDTEVSPRAVGHHGIEKGLPRR
jgi:hypothetical protein